MPWTSVAAFASTAIALLAFINERRQRKAERTKGIDEVVNDRLKMLLTGGPAAVLGEYDNQGAVLLSHLRQVIAQRDSLAVQVEELTASIARLERQATVNEDRIARLQHRVDEVERTNGHG